MRALGVIRRDVFHLPCDPNECAAVALYHDCSEILTGDLPTPIKYYNPQIRDSYKQVEQVACERLLHMLPRELQPAYEEVLRPSDPEVEELVKAADKLAALGYTNIVEFGGINSWQGETVAGDE